MHALKTRAYQNWLDSGKYGLKVSPFHAKEYEHVEMIEMSAYTALMAHAQELARAMKIVADDLDMIAIQPTDIAHMETLKSALKRWHSFEKQLKNEGEA